jgi:hypothetical protein
MGEEGCFIDNERNTKRSSETNNIILANFNSDFNARLNNESVLEKVLDN